MATIKANFGRATFVAWGGTTLDLIDIDSGGITATTDPIESTRYADSVRQFLPGYTDPGSISITVSTDNAADAANLRRNFADHVVGDFAVVLPTGLQLNYTGYIASFTHFLDKHGLYTYKLTIKLSGMPNETPYPQFTIIPVSGSSMYRGSSYGLFLIPGAASTATVGGEGAVWQLVGDHHAHTEIVGNTLIIAPDEAQNQITVKATIYPDESASQAATAVYTITSPAPASIQITGAETLHFNRHEGGEDVESTYTAAVYPAGASQGVKWTLTKVNGAVAENGISIGNLTGILSIDHDTYAAVIGVGTKQYVIHVTNRYGTATITNIKYITVEVEDFEPAD